MFKIIKCRGVLLKAMHRNTQQISMVSFFIISIPMIIMFMSVPEGSVAANVISFILLWYILSVIFVSKSEYEYGVLSKILTFPVFLSLKISVMIFRFFLIRKYPEMEEQHYERWVKLQRLKRKINK